MKFYREIGGHDTAILLEIKDGDDVLSAAMKFRGKRPNHLFIPKELMVDTLFNPKFMEIIIGSMFIMKSTPKCHITTYSEGDIIIDYLEDEFELTYDTDKAKSDL